MATIFGASKTVDAIGEGVGRIVDLIPEGDAAKRADAAKIAQETFSRLNLENGGDAVAQRIRATARPVLTVALMVAWLAGWNVDPAQLMGYSIGVPEAAVFSLAWWFSERGILGLLGGKR